MRNGTRRNHIGTLSRPTPILRLPYDILRLIFLLAYNEEWGAYRTRFAVRLSRVCRSWRAAAIGTSAIWATIVFNHLPPFEGQRILLERSRGALLTIEVCRNYNVKQTMQMVELLRPHVARWRSLAMKLEDPEAKSYCLFFDELRHTAAPFLARLEIENRRAPTAGWTFQPFCGGTPSLTKLLISSCRLKGNTALFGRLTKLEIMKQNIRTTSYSSLTARDILAILTQSASTLRTVRIHDTRCQPSRLPSIPSPPILLPRLVKLYLGAEYSHTFTPTGIEEIFSSITAPGIQHYCFNILTLQYLVSHSVFPFPNLSSLAIRDPIWVEGTEQSVFIRVLSDLPNLRSLEIKNVASFDHMILATLCDKLEELTINGYGLLDDPSGMKDMIVARRHRAKMRGLTDSLCRVYLETFALPQGEVTWLKRNLKEFAFWSEVENWPY